MGWINLLLQLVPHLVGLFGDDTANKITDAGVKAIETIKKETGASTPQEAQAKIQQNPQISDTLKIQLAQIAADAEQKKRQAELATLQAQLAAQDKQRQNDLERFKESLKAEIEDTAAARSTFTDLAKANSRFAWGAPVISVIVTLGFFGILAMLLATNVSTADQGKLQVINVIIGTLATAFATVVTFWLGSSQGSRSKDVASFQIQAQQVKQTSDALKAQSETALKATQAAGQQVPTSVGDAAKGKNFDRCLDVVLQQEGGFSQDPKDPGGATNLGITIGELKRWRGTEVTPDDVKKLTKEEAREIYRTNYWNLMKCDELPAGVDLTVFDFGVNAGPARSVKMLQKIVGVTQDGSVGPITISACKAVDSRDVIHTLAQRRLEYYRSLPTWDHFGHGWTNRTNAVEKASIDMVSRSAS